ncbi:MAG: nucleotide exchange factor GrpE [Candidatus Kerfeldbacteria bacterium]|nr:nucleotide exchange factor GrpE [Candidatus Kerfeldbacteria bacterium]
MKNTSHKPKPEDAPDEEPRLTEEGSSPAAAPEATAEEPQDELAELKQQAGEYLEGWKRARADYQNLQKETAARISQNMKYATEGLLMELLPMVDHFRYAFKGIPESERNSSWLKGIEHIQTNFLKVLQEHGVEIMNTVGQPFNAELHEAVEEVDVPGTPSGEIVEEMAAGFMLGGKIIQHAKVKIAK